MKKKSCEKIWWVHFSVVSLYQKIRTTVIMKTKIDVTKYEHVEEIFWGRQYKSSYNHNYFYSSVLKDLIYEECDDDGYFQYWRLKGTQYLGDYYGVGGIFKDEKGIVELDY